eukprot:750823-Hanusia_phi.AAC.1
MGGNTVKHSDQMGCYRGRVRFDAGRFRGNFQEAGKVFSRTGCEDYIFDCFGKFADLIKKSEASQHKVVEALGTYVDSLAKELELKADREEIELM